MSDLSNEPVPLGEGLQNPGGKEVGPAGGVDHPAQAEAAPSAQSGAARQELPAPPLSAWKRFRLVLKVVEVRLRFIAVLVAVGLFIGYWDTIKNYWDKWTRPQSVAVRQLAPDQEFFCPMHPNVVRSTYEPNGDVPKCPICGMPLSIHKKGEKEAPAAGHYGPHPAHARADPTGRRQDRTGRVRARVETDGDRRLSCL